MRKKDIVLLVVCVLLLSTFSVIVAFPIANCSAAVIDVIYVDDDNTEGPWDGTLEHPYQYIQDGLDNANPGDAVFVFNGTYNEEVTINKTVDLIGEDKNGTFVNGTDYGFIITADWVNLSGFSVYNALN